jgi:hypothetical protein
LTTGLHFFSSTSAGYITIFRIAKGVPPSKS